MDNTYYVLDHISTFPILVFLPDYCRKNYPQNVKEAMKNIQDNWAYITQKNGQDNEKIKIFYNTTWE